MPPSVVQVSNTDRADEAMTRYARGDATAFDVVYDAVAPRLVRYVSRHVRDRARQEDLIQQTFLHMHAARGTFTTGAAVMPWAYAIARRLMIDAERRDRREPVLERDDDRLLTAGGSVAEGESPASAEQLLEAEQANARLTAAYALLSARQRAAFELVKDEGLPYAQAAAVLGTTVTGIKLRVHRATLALREALGPAEASRSKVA